MRTAAFGTTGTRTRSRMNNTAVQACPMRSLAWIVNLHLKRQSSRDWIDNSRIVHVPRLHGDRSGDAWQLEDQTGRASCCEHVSGGTCTSNSTRSVRTILNSGAPSSYAAPR